MISREETNMFNYQAIRISVNGKPTYGDRYMRIQSKKQLQHNEIVSVGNERYIILFME